MSFFTVFTLLGGLPPAPAVPAGVLPQPLRQAYRRAFHSTAGPKADWRWAAPSALAARVPNAG